MEDMSKLNFREKSCDVSGLVLVLSSHGMTVHPDDMEMKDNESVGLLFS